MRHLSASMDRKTYFMNPRIRTFIIPLIAFVAYASACQSGEQPKQGVQPNIWRKLAANSETVNCFIIGANNRVISGTSGGIFFSDNQGKSWKSSPVSEEYRAAILSVTKDEKGIMYAGMSKYGVLVSADNGNSWKLFNEGLQAGGPRNTSAIVAVGDKVLKGTFESGVYLSRNQAKSWLPNNSGIPYNLQSNRMVSVHQLVNTGTTIFALTDLGVRYTTDGTSWEKPAHNGIERLSALSSLTVNGKQLYAGVRTGAKGLFVSSDNGNNWKLSGLENEEIYSLATIRGKVYAGTIGSIFTLHEKTNTWEKVGNGLPADAIVYAIGMVPDGSLLAGIHRGGIYGLIN